MLRGQATGLSARHAGHVDLLRIQQLSKDRLGIQPGSLYPAPYRLQQEGWLASEWGESENNRKAKYYRLTAAGKRRLQSEVEKWNCMRPCVTSSSCCPFIRACFALQFSLVVIISWRVRCAAYVKMA